MNKKKMRGVEKYLISVIVRECGQTLGRVRVRTVVNY